MGENQNNNQEQELDINQLMQIRRDKLAELQEQGKDPFEITKFNRSCMCSIKFCYFKWSLTLFL